MRTPVAFVDANVLFSKTLCDWLFLLRKHTNGGLFVLFSSEDAITEAPHALCRSKPFADGQFTARRKALLTTALDDILEDFPGTPDFPGGDKHEAHIHAAALASNATYLIADDAGFAAVGTDQLPYEVHTADSFLMLVAANAAGAIDAAIHEQIAYFRSVGKSARLDLALEAAGCPTFGECIRKHMERIFTGKSTHGIADELLLAAANK